MTRWMKILRGLCMARIRQWQTAGSRFHPNAKRPRRTANVVIEEMRMLSFMKRDRLSEKLQSSIFGMEEVYPVHVAAYFGDDDAMDFMIASRADPNKKTSMGRTALAVAREFNTCGSHDRFIAMLITQSEP
ncbi:unnamed protein product [Cladocopium goreaui]|uniref:NADPH-dependent diflavin oxidoreductase 1 n=1 Tax=Cladocopium goreaui TaxID=2562237 RepID=A0A9P1DUN2_9DINO|nr:unnamed protein product [Cladocopium goreaui]|mmetsp:Transcript_17516/g.38637  ORF Transcript_17516/g.38637 Transcript_17516/m.38637 type:complete len:131 (+) Transcript_17516:126-518(+)